MKVFPGLNAQNGGYCARRLTQYHVRRAKMQATFNRSQGGRELLLGMANSETLPGILQSMRQHAGGEINAATKQLSETYGIEQESAFRVSQYYFAWMKSQEAHFGNLTELDQQSTNRLIQKFSNNPGFDDWWFLSKTVFNDDFAAHVDHLLEARP